jgi:hypothetical protein
MISFTVAETELPFSFFEEIEVSYEDIALNCIKDKYLEYTASQIELLYEKHISLIEERLFDLKNSDIINDYCVGQIEVDEATGTWGYLEFEILDLSKAQSEVIAIITSTINEVLPAGS